jgi:AcrR family transcriptional regulator
MAHPKIEQEELIEKLFEVFRESGYEGASLMQLSEATGLKKPSLYHRFPGGKEEMVEIVLDYADHYMREQVVKVLEGEGEPFERLTLALHNMQTMYDDGRKACILRALSLGSSLTLFSERIQKSFTLLLDGFSYWAASAHFSSQDAKTVAENILIRIQGALVVARAMQNPTIFRRTIQEIILELKKNQ